MDYLMVVTAAGKSYFVSSDSRSGKQIVRSERIVTSTGVQRAHPYKRQQLYLTFAAPIAK
jgi:hypothetical protein